MILAFIDLKHYFVAGGWQDINYYSIKQLQEIQLNFHIYVLANIIEKKCNQHFKMVLSGYEHGNTIKYC